MTYDDEPLKPFVSNVKLIPAWGWKTNVVTEPLGALHLTKPGMVCSTPLASVIITIPIISLPWATNIFEDELCTNWTFVQPKPDASLK